MSKKTRVNLGIVPDPTSESQRHDCEDPRVLGNSHRIYHLDFDQILPSMWLQ
jgi:hypothetical protein